MQKLVDMNAEELIYQPIKSTVAHFSLKNLNKVFQFRNRENLSEGGSKERKISPFIALKHVRIKQTTILHLKICKAVLFQKVKIVTWGRPHTNLGLTRIIRFKFPGFWKLTNYQFSCREPDYSLTLHSAYLMIDTAE